MRVLIVDDHPLYRDGVRAFLSEIDPQAEAQEAGSLAQARALFVQDPGFDLVLLDLALPDMAPSQALSVEALGEVFSLFKPARVVVVSGHEDDALIRQAVQAGADGYVTKSTDPAVAAQALRLVLAGGVYLPAHCIRSSEAANGDGSPVAALSLRQRQVLHMLLQGKSNKLIARELDIAEGTVKAHLSAIFQVLDVKTRAEAIYKAHRQGWFGAH